MQKKAIAAALTLLVLAGVGGALVYGYWWALKNAWIPYNEYDIRSAGMLRVGDLAPDLELAGAQGGLPSRLSDYYRSKPLVVTFGSYT